MPSGTHGLPQSPGDGAGHGAGGDPGAFDSGNVGAGAEDVEIGGFDAAEGLAVEIEGDLDGEAAARIEQLKDGFGFLVVSGDALGLHANQAIEGWVAGVSEKLGFR